MEPMSAAERLIVGADFKPKGADGVDSIWRQVIDLAHDLKGTGVCIKVNSALRLCGYDLIDDIHESGLRVFADLKLNDIIETLSSDGALLAEYEPEFVTVMCSAGRKGMEALKASMPNTEVLGVTVLTSLDDDDTNMMFSCSVDKAVLRFAKIAHEAEIPGLVSAPKEVEALRGIYGDHFTLNTPAIRPEWAIVPGDDQNPERIMTPAKAIKAGADRIIVARPILLASNRRDAVMRTLDEIKAALA